MRALIRFGQLLLILAVGTAAAALWAFVLSKGPGGALGATFGGAGAPAREAGGPADPTGVERMGETGAKIAFADGRRVVTVRSDRSGVV